MGLEDENGDKDVPEKQMSQAFNEGPSQHEYIVLVRMDIYNETK